MSKIDLMNFTAPDQDQQNWHSDFQSLVEKQAASAFAAREDRSIVVRGGGSVTFNPTTGVMSWSAAIFILSPISGIASTISPGSTTMADGQWCFVSLVRNPVAPVVLSVNVANTLPNNDEAFAIGVRLGSVFILRPFWASGQLAGAAANYPPVPSYTYSVNGLVINFVDGSTDADGTVLSVFWDFGDGNTSTAANPSHAFNNGYYTVIHTATDNSGATGSRSRDIRVYDNLDPNRPVSSFTHVTTGLSISFTDTSTSSFGSLDYWEWNFGDGTAVSTAQNPTHQYALAGSYTVSLLVRSSADLLAESAQTIAVS